MKYGAATQIIVSEYDKEEQKIKIVQRKEIPSTEFTFDNAVKEIIKLSKFWNVQKLYLDRGYGEYQVETLKKRLSPSIVKGVAFNEKIEVTDPSDRTRDKKMVKHFMVNQTSILLERNQLQFSTEDREFAKQMFNYRVVRKTQSGKPVYTSENEHALDAFMLTVYCFTTEFPDIAKILEKERYAQTMKVVDKKLQSNEDEIFEGKFKNINDKDNELEGEPDYVKHMKAIEKSNKGNSSSRGRSSFGGRSSWGSGRSRVGSSPGRSTF